MSTLTLNISKEKRKLTLNISKEKRKHLLTEGPKALRPLFQKFFEQSDEPTKGSEAAVAEAAVTPSAQVPRKVRLSDVVRPVFEHGKGTEYEDQNEHPLHRQFVEKLANTLAKVMEFDSAALTPLPNENITKREAATRQGGFEDLASTSLPPAARICKNREEFLDYISQQDADTMEKRLRTEPRYPRNTERWIEKVADFGEYPVELFTHDDFPTFQVLSEQTDYLKTWAVSYSTYDKGPTKAQETLMNDLLEAMEKCESVESYLSISLSMFWVAAELWVLPPNNIYSDLRRSIVVNLLRYYVAAVLLVESVV